MLALKKTILVFLIAYRTFPLIAFAFLFYFLAPPSVTSPVLFCFRTLRAIPYPFLLPRSVCCPSVLLEGPFFFKSSARNEL